MDWDQQLIEKVLRFLLEDGSVHLALEVDSVGEALNAELRVFVGGKDVLQPVHLFVQFDHPLFIGEDAGFPGSRLAGVELLDENVGQDFIVGQAADIFDDGVGEDGNLLDLFLFGFGDVDGGVFD